MNLRTEEIKIRATLKEKERIKNNAKKCGLSVTQHLIKLANGHTPDEIPSDNFYAVCNQLCELLEIYQGESDEYFTHLLKQILYDLYQIHLKPKLKKDGDSHSHDKNLGS